MVMQTKLSRRAGIRFLVMFMAVFGALQTLMLTSEGTRFERIVIDRATVDVAAKTIDWLFPQDRATAHDYIIASDTVRLSVLRGCEGTEVFFLVVAAVLATPASWRSRVIALAVGCAVAYCANQLRIVALYTTVRDHREYFDLMHGYVAPTCMIVVLLALFMIWIQSEVDKRHTPRSQTVDAS